MDSFKIKFDSIYDKVSMISVICSLIMMAAGTILKILDKFNGDYDSSMQKLIFIAVVFMLINENINLRKRVLDIKLEIDQIKQNKTNS